VNDDRGHVAMPKLYGAPAYARPPLLPVSPVERPFDPDDLPLESERDGEGQLVMDQPAASGNGEEAAASTPSPASAAEPIRFLGRPFRLRLPGRDQARQ
jgi:hypothetical protein